MNPPQPSHHPVGCTADRIALLSDGSQRDTELRKSQLTATVGHMSTPMDRVRDVIARSGMGQGEFALAIGLDAPKLSKSMTGTRRFTSLDVARIAEVGKVSVDWLLSGEEPALAMAARRAEGTSSGAAVDVAKRLAGLRRVANELGQPQHVRLPHASAGPRHGVGERLAAEAVRMVADAGHLTTSPYLASVTESVFGVDVSIVDLGPGFDGLSVAAPGTTMILAAPSPNAARQRFTIAHELGHLCAGDDQEIHLDQDIYAPELRANPSEVQANAFAAAFLMPVEALRDQVKAGFDEVAFSRLTLDCAVSPPALAIRLGRLQLIDKLAVERFKRLTVAAAANLSGRGAELGELTQRSTVLRAPGLLSADLFAAYAAGETTLRPYAALLGVDPVELRESLENEQGGV